jgi:hypothetical protein
MTYTPAQQAGLFHARKRNKLMASVVDSATEPAWGSISFASNPLNLQNITINGTLLTFVTGAPSGSQAQIGTTLADTLANVVAYFAANPVTGVASITASGSDSLSVQSAAPADTTVTLAASNGTVSHPTLQKQKVRARTKLNSITVTP